MLFQSIASQPKRSSGFSLLEVILAVFILSVGIVAVVGLIAGSLRHTLDAREAIIGAQLAQEGVELVRHVRDNNMARAVDAGSGSPEEQEVLMHHFPSGGGANINCVIDKDYDYSSSQPILCNVGNFNNTQLSLSNNYYVHGTGTATKFHRRVVIDRVTSGSSESLVVTSIVKWGAPSNFPAVSNLQNECTVVTHCAFSTVTLRAWKEFS